MVSNQSNFLVLIDTFDTINSGVKNFLICAAFLKTHGINARGVRLDSGNLAELSRQVKKIIFETGEKLSMDFSPFIVVASNDINEKVI